MIGGKKVLILKYSNKLGQLPVGRSYILKNIMR